MIRVYFYPSPVVFLLSCAPAEIAPFDRFSWLMARKACFRVIYVLLGVRTQTLYIFHYFGGKHAKFPIPAM